MYKNKICKINTPIGIVMISTNNRYLSPFYKMFYREEIIWDDFLDRIKDRVGTNKRKIERDTYADFEETWEIANKRKNRKRLL